MANKRVNMRKVRELLRLCIEQDISARQGAKIVGIGKTAASEYVTGFKASGLKIASLEAMSDTELLTILNLKKESENTRYNTLLQLFPHFEKELKRTGVTL
jgi:predicted transcriptional regulator